MSQNDYTLEGELSREQVKLASAALLDSLESTNPSQVKKANDVVRDYTRYRIREDGFTRRILPPTPITNDELDRQLTEEKPVKIVDREGPGQVAKSVPYGTAPDSLYIHADRYQVVFNRIQTKKYSKDVDELRTWHMDVRQQLSDGAIKDILVEEDAKFIRAVNSAVSPLGADVATPTAKVAQHVTIHGGITRDSLADSLTVLESTDSDLAAAVMLLNSITAKQFLKFDSTQSSDSMSDSIIRRGWTEEELLGVKLVITIKKKLVPTNTAYHFADPKFLGKFFVLEDTVMYIRRDGPMIDFYAYENIGCTIGNTNACARIDFA